MANCVVIRLVRRCAAFALIVALTVGCGVPESPGDGSAVLAKPETFRWTLITTWPKNLPGLGMAPERLADNVRRMSGGRLDIKVYGAGELVPAFEVFDAVSQGTAEMGHGAAYYWRGKLPAAAMFSTVPFGMTAQEMNSWLHHGGGLALWRELYEPFQLIPLAAGNSGVQMAGWFNKEINSLADLQGLKMRIPGLGGEVLQRAGGVAVAMPGSEVFTSLQTGVIDATEWVSPFNDLALGLQSVAKYYYYPGWHEPGTTLEALVNKSAWESLPADLQAILETACRAVNTDLLDELTAQNAAALKTLVQEHNVQIRELPTDVVQRLQEVSAQVVAEAGADNELARRIHESYFRFLDDVRAYHAITEQAYINAR
jgi:TRAP-type mannitol/chloroaromatic compound transport system substrate-binding protein